MIGHGCQFGRRCFRNYLIIDDVSTMILNIHLLVGTVTALRTYIDLKRNNYEKAHDWGKKDYKFWCIITFLSIVLTFVNNLAITSASFVATLNCLIRIYLMMAKLDSSVSTFIPNLKKLRSYILIFIGQLVRFFFF
jgi:hypothetical protein